MMSSPRATSASLRTTSAGSPNKRRDPTTPSRRLRTSTTPPTTMLQTLPDENFGSSSASPIHSRGNTQSNMNLANLPDDGPCGGSPSTESEDDIADVAVAVPTSVYMPKRQEDSIVGDEDDDDYDDDEYYSDSFESEDTDLEKWCPKSDDAAVKDTMPPQQSPPTSPDATSPAAKTTTAATSPTAGAAPAASSGEPSKKEASPHAPAPTSILKQSGTARDSLRRGSDPNVRNSLRGLPPGAERPPKPPPLVVERLEKIGRGSFGDVFKAIRKDTGEVIAVKEVVVAKDSRCRDTSKQLHTLEREIRVMQKLDHPNIVKYLGSKRNEDGLSIFMEFADGGTIGGKLRESGPMEEPVVAATMKQLLAGLEYLHSRRIVHRDLKGDNLFLMLNGILKVGDFGTSKELQTMQVSDSVAGTPNFMAPEMIECVGHSIQADIWSVGCCAIQMITGKPPFHKLDNQMAVMFAVLKGQIIKQVPEEASENFKDFITVCTMKDPKQRWPCRMLLEHAFLKSEGGLTSKTAKAPEPAAREPPPVAPSGGRRGSKDVSRR